MTDDTPLYSFKRNPTENVQATVKTFRDKSYMDIRIFYMDDEGAWKPTKKGISLSPDFLPELKEAVAAIEKRLEEMENEE